MCLMLCAARILKSLRLFPFRKHSGQMIEGAPKSDDEDDVVKNIFNQARRYCLFQASFSRGLVGTKAVHDHPAPFVASCHPAQRVLCFGTVFFFLSAETHWIASIMPKLRMPFLIGP
jgi:hypothetical protein